MKHAGRYLITHHRCPPKDILGCKEVAFVYCYINTHTIDRMIVRFIALASLRTVVQLAFKPVSLRLPDHLLRWLRDRQ